MLNNTWPNLFSNVAHFWNSSLSNSSFTLFSNVAHFWNSSLSNLSFKWNLSLPNSNSKHYIWSNCHNAWNLSLANSSLTNLSFKNVLHYWISLTWFFFLNISKIQAVWQKMPPKLCLINKIIIKKKILVLNCVNNNYRIMILECEHEVCMWCWLPMMVLMNMHTNFLIWKSIDL